jgi:hypothetical protein
MEVHDPPNHTRYCELVCPSAAGRIEFLSFGPATSLHKLNFRADKPGVIALWLESRLLTVTTSRRSGEGYAQT